MLRVRQALAMSSKGPDIWSRALEAGPAALEPLQAVGRGLGVARLLVSTDDGDAPIDVWCGPISSRAMRPAPADVRPTAGSRRIYCRSGILALPLRAPQRVVGVLTLIARSERENWSEDQIQGGLELAHWLAEARARFEAGRRRSRTPISAAPCSPRCPATWPSSTRRAGSSRRTTRGTARRRS